ncbi:D-aspartate oxidase [Chionoecetes opilio]|uniref:D-aspartate oxidase n=1 Tax=Chionoecetes opilio TaxID=41210 RepID=A0A8J8WAQ8_CHIOP|nr:D-aspartate oxidase [Chionoecetes opilio]
MVRVVVVGAGVNGVGSALALQRLHPECQITIIAKDFTPNTTGDGAAGLWEPYRKGTGDTPDSKILEWAGVTWQQFSEWYSKGEGKTRGLSLIHGTTLNSVLKPSPSWQHIPLGYASLTPDQCAQFGPRYKSGSRFTTFTAEPSKLLPSLLRDLKALGTRLEVRCLSSLKEAADEADLVINCSGLGARDLVPDPLVFPVRGQVIRSAEVVEEWVGLRPYRSKGVRLEADELQLGNRTIPVVHNYGHGGCGVTLSWGCSQEVARLASRLILRHHGHASKL